MAVISPPVSKSKEARQQNELPDIGNITRDPVPKRLCAEGCHFLCLTSHCLHRTNVWGGTFQPPSLAFSTSPSPPGSAVSRYEYKCIRTRYSKLFIQHCTHICPLEVIYVMLCVVFSCWFYMYGTKQVNEAYFSRHS